MKQDEQMARTVFLTTTFRRCMNNNYLNAQIRNFFTLNGYQIVEREEQAESIVVTTCGFDQPREDQAMALIEQYSRDYPGKKIIVSGCLPGINASVESIANVVPINTNKLSRFDEMFDARQGIKSVRANTFDDLLPFEQHRGLFNIEISKGCTNKCSYCIIRKTKGRLESKPVEQVIVELEDGIERGHDRFCFLSDNCATYGLEIKTDLAELLNRVDAVEGQFKLFLYYAEPQQFLKLYPRIKKGAMRRVCYLDLPVQSGSTQVLASMNRNYTPVEVMQLIQQIKEDHPELVLATQMLVGFPGESEDDFWDSLALGDHFDQVTFFLYTDRAGTAAARMDHKVPAEQIEQRAEILRELIANKPNWQLIDGDAGQEQH